MEKVLTQVDQVEQRLRQHGGSRALALAELLAQYAPLVRQVVNQTQRRVFQHHKVPATDKLVSLFEPQTAIIQRGKAPPNETEFGRKLWYSEVDGGIVSEYRILHGNPPDAAQWGASLKKHVKLFRRPPYLATADRGVFSPKNEQLARQLGVKQVALPKPGAKSGPRKRRERQRWFKAAMRFRAGIEGRISGLKRARQLDRCRNRGEPGLERWVGWGILTNNLVVIATSLARRYRSKKAQHSGC